MNILGNHPPEKSQANTEGALWEYGKNTLIIFLFLLGIIVTYKILQHADLHQIFANIKSLPADKVLYSSLFTALSYIALIGYDWSGIRYAGKKIPFRQIAFTSFIGFSISNTIGISWLSGGALRYRLYSRLGLSASDIAKVIVFCTIGFGIGEGLIGGSALVVLPDMIASYTQISPLFLRWVSVGILILIGGFLFVRTLSLKALKIGKTTYEIPSTRILFGQVVFSIFDICFAGLALFVLLPSGEISMISFLAIYAIALAIGVISHIPGGVGVFEAIMVSALQKYFPLESIVTALICYRAIYYLLPFLLGVFLLVFSELVSSLKKAKLFTHFETPQGIVVASNITRTILPAALAGLTFMSGLALLLGSTIPLNPRLLELVGELSPIGLIETYHLLGGITGVALIVLSRAIWQRIRAAFWVSGFLLVGGAILSILQSFDYSRAIFMLMVMALLVVSQNQFYRKAKLFSNPMSAKWLLLSLGALVSFIWLILFSFKAVPYTHELWWHFALDAQAPRNMRTGLVVTSTFLIFYIINALQYSRRTPKDPSQDMIEIAEKIVQNQDNPDGNFVLMGDKKLLFSEDETSFIMFAVFNKSWIALGDPIGGTSEVQQNLIWDFKALAMKESCRTIFYEVDAQHVDWYIDAGLNLFKLGETAFVNLDSFNLEGANRRKLRQAHNKAAREELSFKVSYPPHSEPLMKQLFEISQQWLNLKHVREKSFSLGRFDEAYLQKFPIALIYHNDDLTAFANVLVTDCKTKATIDLMRHREDAPPSTMDYLFIELMLELKAEGYQQFSLGMAPMSGFKGEKYAHLWDRFGHFVYKKGKRFYNFEGLRYFKSKYDPEWSACYLATSRRGVGPYLDIVDIAALTSGGVKGIFKK